MLGLNGLNRQVSPFILKSPNRLYEKECHELRQKIIEHNQRHNLTLTLLGEKSEECEELKLDLQDVKDMFKQQTEEMLTRLAK